MTPARDAGDPGPPPAARPEGSVAGDAARLALGTLTALPVPAPRRVDAPRAGWAMTLAPLVGLLLAVLPGLLVVLVGREAPLPVAAGVLGLLALQTRGLHLDGLADTADGLGSGLPASQALEVMRRGDVGPFGVVTLVTVLLLQAACLATLIERGEGAAGLVLALVAGRLVLPLLCVRGVPAARADGLGHLVVGSVPPGRSVVAVVVAAAGTVAVTAALTTTSAGASMAAVAFGLLAAGALAHRAIRRLGGVTGDVLGAGVETAVTATLLVLVVA